MSPILRMISLPVAAVPVRGPMAVPLGRARWRLKNKSYNIHEIAAGGGNANRSRGRRARRRWRGAVLGRAGAGPVVGRHHREGGTTLGTGRPRAATLGDAGVSFRGRAAGD